MPYFIKKRASSRGQTSLETAFVFTSVLFFAFVGLNLAASMHTKFIATYAAFMAARSYQVYGDQTGADAFQETGSGGTQELLEDEQALVVLRTAEDIFTCALPWVKPPDGDGVSSAGDDSTVGCLRGKRRYQDTNINPQLAFLSFENPDDSPSGGQRAGNLLSVTGGYAENGRNPLRYAILKLQYKNRLLINPYNVFDGTAVNEDGQEVEVTEFDRRRLWHRVYVPALLNPGLESGVSSEPIEDPGPVDESVTEEDVEAEVEAEQEESQEAAN